MALLPCPLLTTSIATPLVGALDRPGPVEHLEYILRQLFVRRGTELTKSVKYGVARPRMTSGRCLLLTAGAAERSRWLVPHPSAVGPGAQSLVAAAKLAPDLTPMRMATEEMVRLAEAFTEWPDRPTIEDTDVELTSRW